MIISNAINIAKTNCYEMYISRTDNSAELIFKGFWNETDEMQYYLVDIMASVDMLKPNFTFIIDMIDFSGCISKYLTLTIEAQKYIVSKGLKVTAEVLPPNPMLRPVCEMLSKESNMETIYFNNRASAKEWLNLSTSDDWY